MGRSSDRRFKDRRGAPLVEEPVARRGERRAGDRRTSARAFVRLRVRERGARDFAEKVGNVGLDGAYFVSRELPETSELDVRFALQGSSREYALAAQIVRCTMPARGAFGLHLRFLDLDGTSALALARALS